MTERYIERLLAEEADEAKVWEAIEEFFEGGERLMEYDFDKDGPLMSRRCLFTNADRIRGMSDEELAEYHADNCRCPHDPVFGCKMATIGCVGCWLDWLRQEASDVSP